MGRITIFTASGCPHCTRAKRALQDVAPFVEINVEDYPQRRKDMLQLANRLSVPQVFFNEEHIGGADELIALLSVDADKVKQTLSAEDPSDERLIVPSPEDQCDSEEDEVSKENASQSEKLIQLPDGKYASVLEVMVLLDGLFEKEDRQYSAHCYTNSFINTQAVCALREHYQIPLEEAVAFGRKLQDHGILDHVCGDHQFRADGYYFFRLQRYQQPDILNSFCQWQTATDKTNSDFASILKRIKKMQDGLLARHINSDGLIDYVEAHHDPSFVELDYSMCELQVLDIRQLDQMERAAFCLNLYNIIITFAFIKVGIGMTTAARGSFFSQVKVQLAKQQCFSLDQLEHGILRANTRHPYATRKPFAKDDPRYSTALDNLDHRIHFALNCGAKSCPPIKFFHAESLEEELRLVAESFCENEETVSLNPSKQEMTVTMLLKWYERDFCSSKDQLASVILPYLRSEKRDTLAQMISIAKDKPISVKYHTYDWSTNASNFESYSKKMHTANKYNPTALLTSTC